MMKTTARATIHTLASASDAATADAMNGATGRVHGAGIAVLPLHRSPDTTTTAVVTAAWERFRELYHRRNMLCFIALGFINNYHYCVVISGAEAVAELFHLKNLMALVSWANIVGGIFVRFLNAFVLMHWSYNKKMLVAGLQTLAGLAIVCCAPYCGTSDGFRFFLTLVGVMNIGNGSSFGEQTLLGYLEQFPARLLGGWSSGTGMSGVVGSLAYLGLSNTSLSNSAIFAVMIPFVFAYYAAFYSGVVLVPRREVRLRGGGADGTEPSFSPLANHRRTWSDASSNHAATTTTAGGASTGGASTTELEIGADNAFTREHAPLLQGVATATATAPPAVSPSESGADLHDHSHHHRGVATCASNDGGLYADDADDLAVGEDAESSSAIAAGGGGGVDAAKLDLQRPPVESEEVSDAERDARVERELANWGCFRRFLFRVEAIVECNRLILFQGMNLCLVYVFEYAIQFVAPNMFPNMKKLKAGASSPALPPRFNVSTTTTATMTTSAAPGPSCSTAADFDFATRNAFVVSQFCYQFGVLLSRSSLAVVRIRRVEALTALQLINLLAWLVLAKTQWLVDDCDAHRQVGYTLVMCGWMVLVGLMGGASYVNVFFNILNDEDLRVGLARISRDELARQRERQAYEERRRGGAEAPHLTPFRVNAKELAMNVGALYQTVGITTGSLFDVIIDNTLLKQ